MGRIGGVVTHPAARERVTFQATARETGGDYVRWERAIASGAFPEIVHVHPRCEEQITILTGDWTFCLSGEECRLGQGDIAVAPVGTPHGLWNSGAGTGAAIIEIRPAGRIEEYIETLFGLAQDGMVDPLTGLPVQPWLALIVMEYHHDVAYPATIPLPELLDTMRPIAEEAGRQCLRLPYPYPYPAAVAHRSHDAD